MLSLENVFIPVLAPDERCQEFTLELEGSVNVEGVIVQAHPIGKAVSRPCQVNIVNVHLGRIRSSGKAMCSPHRLVHPDSQRHFKTNNKILFSYRSRSIQIYSIVRNSHIKQFRLFIGILAFQILASIVMCLLINKSQPSRIHLLTLSYKRCPILLTDNDVNTYDVTHNLKTLNSDVSMGMVCVI